jgi:hypothetical protein
MPDSLSRGAAGVFSYLALGQIPAKTHLEIYMETGKLESLLSFLSDTLTMVVPE